MKRLRVIVCDDQRTVRESLAEFLRAQPAVATVHVAANPDQAINLARRGADVLVLDLVLGYGESGLDVLEAMRHLHIVVPVLAIAADSEVDLAVRAIILGARGFCPKSASPSEFYGAVVDVADGTASVPDNVVAPLLTTLDDERRITQDCEVILRRLTDRERLVLRLLSRGLSRTEIADRLALSTNTVRTHLHNIMVKLGVSSQIAAAALGRELLAAAQMPTNPAKASPVNGRVHAAARHLRV